jgi:lipopolysaccharide/colanic/teichoic acid biosynthesis glycosyltransferase
MTLGTGDLLAVILGALAAAAIPGGPPEGAWTIACLFALPVLFAALGLNGRRRPGSWQCQAGQVRALLRAAFVASVAEGSAVGLAGHAAPLSALLVFGATVAATLVAVGTLHGALAHVLPPERILLVGDAGVMQRFARGLRSRQDVEVVDHVPAVREAAELDPDAIDHVVVGAARVTAEELVVLLHRFGARRVPISLLAASIHGPLVGVRAGAPSAPSRAIKRATDVLGAGVALLLLAPLMLLIALAIRFDSPGPALFAQRRVGRHGRVFVMLKFRTMVAGAQEMRQALLVRSRDPHWLHIDDDPRVTRVGRLLRRSSLDELPQLWNVLRGQMSLVGPRPLVEVEHENAPTWARPRSDVNPGITGLWQVSGRTAIPFEEMLRLDGMYVTTWSLANDLWILVRTLPAVLSARGAN